MTKKSYFFLIYILSLYINQIIILIAFFSFFAIGKQAKNFYSIANIIFLSKIYLLSLDIIIGTYISLFNLLENYGKNRMIINY